MRKYNVCRTVEESYTMYAENKKTAWDDVDSRTPDSMSVSNQHIHDLGNVCNRCWVAIPEEDSLCEKCKNTCQCDGCGFYSSGVCRWDEMPILGADFTKLIKWNCWKYHV